MSAAVLIVTGLFFVIGITVGVIIVVAMAGVRSDRRAGPADPPGYERRGRGGEPPDSGQDHQAYDQWRRWPEDSGNWNDAA